jgi:hypothetical protein
MIVCLGWGSLIWQPKCLPVKGDWQTDGPRMPVEFSRQSADGRITLVIDSGAEAVTVLWAELEVDSMLAAQEALRKRENTASRNIGTWPSSKSSDISKIVVDWAIEMGVSGAVWTALPPKFGDTVGTAPTTEQVISYLDSREGDHRALAEEYERRAPTQIATLRRSEIEMRLGWHAQVIRL